jgi:thymidylate kinase
MRPASSGRRTRVVSFSGIDGAGKSTQIAALRRRLRELGLEVLVIPFWDDVACFTRMRQAASHALFRGDTGVGTPENPIHRRDKNVRSPLMTVVRLGLYFLDAVALRLTIREALACGADFVICDRYAWDELANLTLHQPLARTYARLLLWIIPRPDVSYLLDADPMEARARKPEYPVDFLQYCREAYLTLSCIVGGVTVIPPMPAVAVEEEILKHISVHVAQQRDEAMVRGAGEGTAA